MRIMFFIYTYMINSKPNQPLKYRQGLFVPKNKDKVIKLNNNGGLYYRSGLEHRLMVYLDNKTDVIRWGSENIKVPYIKKVWESKLQSFKETEHNYYPDFYYELRKSDGSTSRVVVEVKPKSETIEPKIPINPTAKQLKNLEYSLKMYTTNLAKWKYMIEYCKIKGFEFIILTEEHLGNK